MQRNWKPCSTDGAPLCASLLPITGDLDLCPHLSPAAPQPTFWSAWDPGWVRCGRCIGPEADAIKGTDEEHRCDYCRRVSDRIHHAAVLLPAIVADMPGLVAASGPVTVLFGTLPGLS